MIEPTGSLRDAASTIFNLPDYRVIDAVVLPDGGRQIVVESTAPPGCPVCGVIAVRVHSRRWQVVRDVPTGGAVRVVWDKVRRLLATGSLADAHEEKMRLDTYVLAANMPETDVIIETNEFYGVTTVARIPDKPVGLDTARQLREDTDHSASVSLRR